MQKRNLTAIVYLVAVIVLSVISGCGKGNASTTINSVTITPGATSVATSAEVDFTATVNLSNATTTTSTGSTVTTSTSTAVSWEVNGIVGGNATIGTIVSLTTDNQVGVYTAPATVPTTNNGQVNITAVAQQVVTTGSTANTTITSNTAIVTVGGGEGFAISPSLTTVVAGETVQFAATLNGVADANATWSVSSGNGGNVGTIGSKSGTYVAPPFPPPGASLTVTGQDGANSTTETLTIVYSDRSLNGPYAFSYTGDNSLGFYGVAGSFEADGNGNIESGLEDVDSYLTGVSTEVPISGTYAIGADGRGTASFTNGTTWRFVMSTNQHGLITRFDANNTGSGMIDQQNLSDLTTSSSVIAGPYVFKLLGADASFNPLGIVGKFSANGGGLIPVGSTILDANDNGSVAASDRTLNGSYSFDTTFPGTGRGTLTLTSTATGQRQYAFYVTDNTHLYLVEIDHNAYAAGDLWSGATGTSFSNASFTSSNYVFTVGGNSSSGAYAAGGIFASDGNGDATGGVFDGNNAGTTQLNTTITSCPYTVDSSTGRIDLKLCPGSTHEFAAYQTSQGPSLMLELDSTAVAAGVAYQQQGSATEPTGSFALRLTGQGIFHNSPFSYQPDASGQVTLSGSGLTSGTLDINNYTVVFPSDSLTSSTGTTTTSSVSTPSTTGRGTAVLAGTAPLVTYNLVYYFINSSTALFFDQDKTFILTGILTQQF